MLTEKQLNNLNLLTLNIKYGKIVSDAIITWRKKEVCPARYNFGLDFLEEIFKLYKNKTKENPTIEHYCCILGAAVVGKPNTLFSKNGNFYELIAQHYNITFQDALEIARGFDWNEILEDKNENEAFKFGHDVKKALWD